MRPPRNPADGSKEGYFSMDNDIREGLNAGEDQSQIALNCYLQALTAFGRAAAEICPHIGSPYQSSLIRARQRLSFEPSRENLLHSVEELETELVDFGHRVCEYYTLKSGDIASILDVVTQSVETFETRDQMYLERMGLLVRQLETGLQATDNPEAARLVFEQQLGHLRTFLERLTADSKAVFNRLRDDIGTIEERLLRAETEASIDALTSLVTRRELERMIRDRVPTGKIFSLLLFDVRSLSSIVDRFGADAGDQLLRQFGARLVAQVRPRDIVARWGEAEFAVVFDCPAAAADDRAKQIAEWLSGRYPIDVNGQDWKAEVEAAIAVVEYRAGEAGNDFIRRANAHVRKTPTEFASEAGTMETADVTGHGWRTL